MPARGLGVSGLEMRATSRRRSHHHAMSEDEERIKLPWEDQDDDEPARPTVADSDNATRVGNGPGVPEVEAEGDSSRASGFAGPAAGPSGPAPTPVVSEVPVLPPLGAAEERLKPSVDEPPSEQSETTAISWSSGAVERRERGKAGTGGSRSVMAWAKLAARLRGDERSEEDDKAWLAESEQPREIGGWLSELHAAESSSDQPEIFHGGSSMLVDYGSDEGSGDFDSSADVLAGPRPEVSVPRISRGRIGVVGSAVLLLALLVGIYAVIIPSIRGRNYRSELRSAFSNTEELRMSLSDVLAGGRIPEDLAGAGVHYRELANSYSLYAKVVAAPPPAKPLISLSSSMREALSARESLLALNDSLGPAVDQVRSRGNYLDTLAAVADQMRIAQAVLGPDGQADAEAVLITEATVANATSLNAVLSTQQPPTGYEVLHARLLGQLGEYVKTGRDYSLALKKSDEGSASGLREGLYKSARSFEDVITEPVGQGAEAASMEAIERRSEEATLRLQ